MNTRPESFASHVSGVMVMGRLQNKLTISAGFPAAISRNLFLDPKYLFLDDMDEIRLQIRIRHAGLMRFYCKNLLPKVDFTYCGPQLSHE